MAKQSKSPFLKFIDFVLVIITISSALALFCVLISPYVNPNQTVIFAFVALVAPIIYLVNIVMLLIWILRWKAWLIVNALPMLWGVLSIGEYVQFPWRIEYDEINKKSSLSVVTYNVYRFEYFREGGSTLEPLLDSLAKLDADIICLQEFEVRDSVEIAKISEGLSDYNYFFCSNGQTQPSLSNNGLAVFSKFQLQNSSFVSFEDSVNGFLVTDVIVRDDTIKLFNCHLQTTQVNRVGGNRGLRSMMLSENREQVAEQTARALARNFRLRANQADSLRNIADNSNCSLLIVGDFNTPVNTYTYRTVRGDLADSFCEKGVGYGSTFRAIKGLLRIDYVLYDDTLLECMEYESPDWTYSDHRPVITRFNVNK